MKIVINIPDGYNLNDIQNGSIACGQILKAVKNGIPYEERQQGKWITIGEEQGALGIIYKIRKCSKCGWEHSLVIPNNFCPNCSADMRGKEE
jgi:hypothetical protein